MAHAVEVEPSTVVWTEGAGHVLTLDYGWEELAQRTIAWLNARW